MEHGDFYMHLADLASYAQAQQRLGELYANPEAWDRKAIINVACSGKFSSDRTIAEYAAQIWNAAGESAGRAVRRRLREAETRRRRCGSPQSDG